jgi:peptidoglycan biosynthesis protein MviN/MurJ (putative lipid II flippase)
MVLLSILAVLFVSLFLLIFLAERFGKQESEASLSKITRWIFPLMLLLMLLQGLRYIL